MVRYFIQHRCMTVEDLRALRPGDALRYVYGRGDAARTYPAVLKMHQGYRSLIHVDLGQGHPKTVLWSWARNQPIGSKGYVGHVHLEAAE